VIGQAYPEEFSEIINLGLQNNAREAFSKFYRLTESIDLIFEEGNPVGIKSLLQQMEICGPDVRLPLTKASENLQQKITKFVVGFKIEEYVI
jgi:4-hydroxy-tetrahydrodipicolinate synthase